MAEMMHIDQSKVVLTLKQCAYLAGVSDKLEDEEFTIIASCLMTGTYKRLSPEEVLDAFKLYSEGVLNVSEKFVFSYKLVGDVLKAWKEHQRTKTAAPPSLMEIEPPKSTPQKQWESYLRLIRLGEIPFTMNWEWVYEYGTENNLMPKPENPRELKERILKENPDVDQKEFNRLCCEYWCKIWGEMEITKNGGIPKHLTFSD